MRVLLIEDDLMIGRALVTALAGEGMSVDWARDGEDGAEALRGGGHALVLLDLGLPGMGGLELLDAARRRGTETPVLIITASGSLDARLEGLDAGADDVLGKPFDTRELLARMRAVLRRRMGMATSRLVAGVLELDLAAHALSNGRRTELLPAREFALMQALMGPPGRVLSRGQIEERIYGWGEEVESNAVDALIHSVRRKFGKDIILNLRGAGWMVPKA